MKYIRITSPDTEIKRGNNKITIEVNGSEVRDIKSFYEILVNNLEFPGYFGDNLDALYDMLIDLQWLKQDTIDIIISDYEDFLTDEVDEDKAEIMLLLEDVCREWKEGYSDDEDWEMKKVRVYVLCDEITGKQISRMIADMTEEE